MDNTDEIQPVRAAQIVFVDDMPQLLAIATKMLRKLGFTTEGFTSAAEALDYVTRHCASIGLVITDQSMPEMSGIELARRINALVDAPPVILATSLHAAARLDDYLAIGISGLLPKPFSVSDLQSVVSDSLAVRP